MNCWVSVTATSSSQATHRQGLPWGSAARQDASKTVRCMDQWRKRRKHQRQKGNMSVTLTSWASPMNWDEGTENKESWDWDKLLKLRLGNRTERCLLNCLLFFCFLFLNIWISDQNFLLISNKINEVRIPATQDYFHSTLCLCKHTSLQVWQVWQAYGRIEPVCNLPSPLLLVWENNSFRSLTESPFCSDNHYINSWQRRLTKSGRIRGEVYVLKTILHFCWYYIEIYKNNRNAGFDLIDINFLKK